MKTIARICLLVFSFSTSFAILAAPPKTETSEAGNTYISGAELKVASPVLADLFAAGGRISVDSQVGADAAIAGGAINVRAPVKQDLRVAGRAIDIAGRIGGDLLAAGGSVKLQNTAEVAGSAWLAGRDIVLAGKLGKGAKIYGNSVTLSGEISGDTQLYAREIVFTPGAKIIGNLSYASPNPLSPDTASQVRGTITREPESDNWYDGKTGVIALSLFHFFSVLGMLAAGALLYLVFPRAVAGTQNAIREYPLRSLLTGLALLFVIPPLAILFMVTVVGIPIGLMLLALYPLVLLLGYLAAAFFISRKAADAMKQPQQLQLGRQILFLGLALVLLSVAAWIPFLGGVILLVALVTGIGGWAVWMRMQFNDGKAPPHHPAA